MLKAIPLNPVTNSCSLVASSRRHSSPALDLWVDRCQGDLSTTAAALQPRFTPCGTLMPLDSNRNENRRGAILRFAGLMASTAIVAPQSASALGFKKNLRKPRRLVIPDDQYKDGPGGLKYVDLTLGTGLEAKVGERVAIHYDCKWRGITFVTSRLGMGVTGGTPFGFDLGAESGTPGGTLQGLDLGVRGMRVGGLRRLKVPPELAYGNKQVGEIPPNSTLDIDVELLSIKKSTPFGKQKA